MAPKHNKKDQQKPGLDFIGQYNLDNVNIGYSKDTNIRTLFAGHRITKSRVVVKISELEENSRNEGIKKLHHVARILSQVRHPHIIRLYEILQVESRFYAIVLEKASGGTLEQYVKMEPGYLTETATKYWLRQLISALRHLHDRGVVHRNLHPSKILLDEKRKYLKISDFSYAYNCRHESAKHSQPMQIHPYNNAPELSDEDNSFHPTTIDIWSLGVITFFMLNGTHPFPEQENDSENISPQSVRNWKAVSPECQDLLRRMLEHKSDRRAGLLEIETHEWMAKEPDQNHHLHNPPPRNHILRNVILQKLSRILRVQFKQLQARVHEYRVDELSAMANLMIDDYLAMKDDSDRRNIPKTKIPISETSHPKARNCTRQNNFDGGGDVEFGVHSYVEGKRVDFKRTSKHRRCRSALHQQSFKLQSNSNTVHSKANAIPAVRSEISPRTFNNSKVRPLGNATSYNMAVARSIYQSTSKNALNIAAQTYCPSSGRNVESTVNIQRMQPTVKPQRNMSYSRRCMSAVTPNDLKRPTTAGKRPKSCSRLIQVKIQNTYSSSCKKSTPQKVEGDDDAPFPSSEAKYIHPLNSRYRAKNNNNNKESETNPLRVATPMYRGNDHNDSAKTVKSANAMVKISPSVITLDAKGIADNWKMCSGAITPSKKLIPTFKRSNKLATYKGKASKPRAVSAVEMRHIKHATDTIKSQIGPKVVIKTAWDTGDNEQEIPHDDFESENELEFVADADLEDQKTTARMKKKCIDILSKSPQGYSSPYARKTMIKASEGSAVKINDLYQMLSQDLDNYLSQRVLPKSSSLFLTSSNAMVSEYLGRTPPQTKPKKRPQRPPDFNRNKEKFQTCPSPNMKMQRSSYNLQENPKSFIDRKLKKKSKNASRRLKSAPASRSKTENTAPSTIITKRATSSNTRQLGDISTGKNVSTCTACDLQQLMPMTMLTSSLFIGKSKDTTNDDQSRCKVDISNYLNEEE